MKLNQHNSLVLLDRIIGNHMINNPAKRLGIRAAALALKKELEARHPMPDSVKSCLKELGRQIRTVNTPYKQKRLLAMLQPIEAWWLSTQEPIILEEPPEQKEEETPPSPVYFTQRQLRRDFNGMDSKPAYIAVSGIVYDVTGLPQWELGSHHGVLAGQDVTEQFFAHHADTSILPKERIVGRLMKQTTGPRDRIRVR